MCSVGEFATCSVFQQNRIVAKRKPQQCDACRRVIPTGATYVRHFSVFEGAVDSEKMCLDCESICDMFAADHDGFRFLPSSMPEILDDCVDEFFDPANARHWVEAGDWMRLGRWLFNRQKFNRTITSEATCHS